MSGGESRTAPRRGTAPTVRNRVSRGEGRLRPVVTKRTSNPSAASKSGILMSAGSSVLNSRNSNPSSVVTELFAFVNQATAISTPTDAFPCRLCVGGSRVLRNRDRLTDDGRQIGGSDCEVFERRTRLASTRSSTRFVQRRRRSASHDRDSVGAVRATGRSIGQKSMSSPAASTTSAPWATVTSADAVLVRVLNRYRDQDGQGLLHGNRKEYPLHHRSGNHRIC